MDDNLKPEKGANRDTPDASRRQFIGYLLGFSVTATLVGVLMPVLGYIWPPSRSSGGGATRTQVGTLIDFPVGQGQVVAVNDKPVVVVNTAQGGLRAFSGICTHLGCISEWDQQRQIILCPCHDGRFNPVNGSVISGPPPTPLPQYQVFVEEDIVYVSDSQA